MLILQKTYLTQDIKVNKYLSVQELSEALGISEETVYSWTSQKRIPFIKVGRCVRFDQDEVKAWLDKNRVMPYDGRR
jgi:excisionase family DNA binding protein